MLEKTDEEAELEKSSDVLKTGRALTVEEEEGDAGAEEDGDEDEANVEDVGVVLLLLLLELEDELLDVVVGVVEEDD